jgi:hypothetical protein
LGFASVEVVAVVVVVEIVIGSTKAKQGLAVASKDSIGSGPGRGK